jgi:imidazolonepropionase-like amidohydrolase
MTTAISFLSLVRNSTNKCERGLTLFSLGGVTTANVLPGSANAIGGQAFTIKLRRTAQKSPTSFLLEPPFTANGTYWEDVAERPRWRQLKQACGENPSGVYGFTRMDTIWSFRAIYNEARKIKEAQDDYCTKASAHQWNGLGAFPESLKYEALVDVLRGRVKVHTHCYETVDFDALVRLTQEFKFPIAAVHHAHEAYLVPDLLKSAYGHPPAVALFATNARYKREAYRGSEFAPRILNQHGLKVVMKSDHPVMNERDLLFEAQQAFFYGLPAEVALSAVTSTAADILGYGHRIGYIKPGYDADLVIWDSHPLALGATVKQVFIDGISQLQNPYTLNKPASFQKTPEVPNFDQEAEAVVKHDGLPPLAPKNKSSSVLFSNVAHIYDLGPLGGNVVEHSFVEAQSVFVKDGKIECIGTDASCAHLLGPEDDMIDLEGGSIQPGLTTFGSPQGVVEIMAESSTNDGVSRP